MEGRDLALVIFATIQTQEEMMLKAPFTQEEGKTRLSMKGLQWGGWGADHNPGPIG